MIPSVWIVKVLDVHDSTSKDNNGLLSINGLNLQYYGTKVPSSMGSKAPIYGSLVPLYKTTKVTPAAAAAAAKAKKKKAPKPKNVLLVDKMKDIVSTEILAVYSPSTYLDGSGESRHNKLMPQHIEECMKFRSLRAKYINSIVRPLPTPAAED